MSDPGVMSISSRMRWPFADSPEAEIAALKRQARLLEQQGVLLQQILDHIGDGILTVDEDWLIVASNDGFDRLLGLPHDVLLTGTPFGDVLTWLARRGDYGAGDPSRIAAGLIARMERRAHWYDERETADGRVICWRVCEMPGRGRIVTISDTADRRHGGSRRAQDHDMAPPLLAPLVTISDHAGARMRRLGDFSCARRDDGAETDVQDSVIRVVDLIRETIDPDIVLRLDLHRQDRRVALGPTEVQQIVMNLVLNAAQAIGAGAGTIVIQTTRVDDDDPRFRASPGYDPTRSYIRLSVIDDGPGIPDEVLPRIFEPFFTTRQAGQAAGLGLAVVAGLVAQAGGWVDVIGRSGARFDVLLPTIDGRLGEGR